MVYRSVIWHTARREKRPYCRRRNRVNGLHGARFYVFTSGLDGHKHRPFPKALIYLFPVHSLISSILLWRKSDLDPLWAPRISDRGLFPQLEKPVAEGLGVACHGLPGRLRISDQNSLNDFIMLPGSVQRQQIL